MKTNIKDFITAPLSFAQERLWTLEKLSLNSHGSYNLVQCLELNGSLDKVLLKKSLQALIKRHQALRTNFIFNNNSPMQLVRKNINLNIKYHDLQKNSKEVNDRTIRKLVQSERIRSFDLSNDLLMRIHLIKLSSEKNILLIIFHHIIIDGWSLKIFCRDLIVFYTSFKQKMPPILPNLTFQYTDFTNYQRQQLIDGCFSNQFTYWINTLKDLPITEIPTDKVRSSKLIPDISEQKIVITGPIAQAITNLCKQEKITPFIFFLTSFYLLLHTYSGQNDLAVGTLIANRNNAEIENLIGFFVNTLVLRINLNKFNSPRYLLQKVRELVLNAQNNQDVPFEKLVEVLRPGRDLTQNPLFQLMFTMQEAPITEFKMENLIVNLLDIEADPAPFDITFTMHKTKNGFSGIIQYDIDLFEKDTVTKFLYHYEQVLKIIINNLDLDIRKISLINETERYQLLSQWNSEYFDIKPYTNIVTLLDQHITQNNEKVALTTAQQTITYSQLDNLANYIKWKLYSSGIKPGMQIAICLDRSIESIIALIGILRLGACFIPLDQNYPNERINFVLEQTSSAILLTTKKIIKHFSINTISTSIMFLDDIIPKSKYLLPLIDSINIHPCSTAYIIYTSGSTGIPKGVVVSHYAFARKCQSLAANYQLTRNDKVLQFASLSFDVALEEIFPTLICGATLVINNQVYASSIRDFINFIKINTVTVLNLPTPFWHEWVNEVDIIDHSIPTLLRLVIVGSQQILSNKLLRWSLFVPKHVEFVNAYGVTEAVITSITCYLNFKEPNINSVPIGRPLNDTKLYVLDKYLRPVPIGCYGELYIGGTSIALGYLKRPDLTAESFIADPFSTKAGIRLYRTGDFVRYLNNGNIIYIRRRDTQIKIRGFRIEITEIENAFTAFPEIREVAVKYSAEYERLEAYIVPKKNCTISNTVIKTQLALSLPSYMVPTCITILNNIPKTTSGKVDYKSLEIPDKISKLNNSLLNGMEEKIASIWLEVLNLKQVGRNDNFFDLGGDSILSIRVAAKANKYGINITPQQLFHYQTIADLVPHINFSRSTLRTKILKQIFLTPTQKKFFEQVTFIPGHWNRSLLIKPMQELSLVALETAIVTLVKHHTSLRFRYKKIKNNWRVHVEKNSNSNELLIYRDLSKISQNKQELQLKKEINLFQNFNLTQGPLIRLVVFFLGQERGELIMLIVHTLVADTHSWSIILDDLFTVYNQCCNNQKIRLAKKTSEFAEWTNCLYNYAQSNEAEQEINEWLKKIGKINSIPTDYKGKNLEKSQSKVGMTLNEFETIKLLRLLPSSLSVKINSILLTALSSTICKWANSPVLVDLGQHGRNILTHDLDVSLTIGNFIVDCPILLPFHQKLNASSALEVIHKQLDKLPCYGLGPDLIKYLSNNDNLVNKIRVNLPRPQVSFDFISTTVFKENDKFRLVNEISFDERSQQDKRSHILQIVMANINNKLQFEFRYSNKLYKKATILKLAENFYKNLLDLTLWHI